MMMIGKRLNLQFFHHQGHVGHWTQSNHLATLRLKPRFLVETEGANQNGQEDLHLHHGKAITDALPSASQEGHVDVGTDRIGWRLVPPVWAEYFHILAPDIWIVVKHHRRYKKTRASRQRYCAKDALSFQGPAARHGHRRVEAHTLLTDIVEQLESINGIVRGDIGRLHALFDRGLVDRVQKVGKYWVICVYSAKERLDFLAEGVLDLGMLGKQPQRPG